MLSAELVCCNLEFRNFICDIQTISLIGFNYKFNALNTSSEKSELLKAFHTLFRAGTSSTILPMMKAIVPVLRFLVSFFFVLVPSGY